MINKEVQSIFDLQKVKQSVSFQGGMDNVDNIVVTRNVNLVTYLVKKLMLMHQTKLMTFTPDFIATYPPLLRLFHFNLLQLLSLLRFEGQHTLKCGL